MSETPIPILPPPAARRLLRNAASMSLTDIARLVGVTRSAVSRWERGERQPRGHNRTRYSEILNELRRLVVNNA